MSCLFVYSFSDHYMNLPLNCPLMPALHIGTIELNCTMQPCLGVQGFATSSRRSQTVSTEIQISNHCTVASFSVCGPATGSQDVVHR